MACGYRWRRWGQSGTSISEAQMKAAELPSFTPAPPPSPVERSLFSSLLSFQHACLQASDASDADFPLQKDDLGGSGPLSTATEGWERGRGRGEGYRSVFKTEFRAKAKLWREIKRRKMCKLERTQRKEGKKWKQNRAACAGEIQSDWYTHSLFHSVLNWWLGIVSSYAIFTVLLCSL